VASRGVCSSVATTTRSTSASLIRRGAPGRGSSHNPSSPVASAFGSWSEARGSLLQLLLNIVVLIVVGLLTLKFVRLLWRRINDRRIGNR
jgi:hypothetical protein